MSKFLAVLYLIHTVPHWVSVNILNIASLKAGSILFSFCEPPMAFSFVLCSI